MEKIPTDNHIRTLLDTAPQAALRPCFGQVLEQLRQRDGQQALPQLSRRMLIALDGTNYFCSLKRNSQQCLIHKRPNCKTEHYHSMLAAPSGSSCVGQECELTRKVI
jgi:hypothetical protein